MATAISIDAKTIDGRTLEQLGRAVELRRQHLAETTANAAVATMIRALESIRAKTRIANPKKHTGGIAVAKAPGVFPGYKRDGGFNRRCLRVGPDRKAAEYHGPRKVVNIAGKYLKGEHVESFLVTEIHSKDPKTAKPIQYYVIARTIEAAREYAHKRHERHVRVYAGMAKRSLGQLMHQVSGKNSLGIAVSARANRIIKSVNRVRKDLGGFSSGNVSIHVLDGLNYAIPAVAGGSSEVNTCVQRAINGIVGQINSTLARRIGAERDKPFSGKLEVPFPEVKGKR